MNWWGQLILLKFPTSVAKMRYSKIFHSLYKHTKIKMHRGIMAKSKENSNLFQSLTHRLPFPLNKILHFHVAHNAQYTDILLCKGADEANGK